MKIAVVIPCLNEEATIAQTIRGFYEIDKTLHFLIVDNNSSDSTSKVAKDVLSSLGANGMVIKEKRPGKGHAVRTAFQTHNADIFVMVDGDLTYPPEELQKLMAPILAGEAHMVVGDRLINGSYFHENKRRFHNFGNKFINKVISVLFKAEVNDVLSGFRAFSNTFVNTYPDIPAGFELEVDLTLHALDKRISIVEVPITYVDRPEGSSSKLNTIRDGTRILKKIFGMMRLYKPGVFYGIISAVLLLCGLLAGVQPVIDWITSQYVYKVPLAILAVGFVILSALALSVGLVLDSVAKLSKREFELSFLRELKKNI